MREQVASVLGHGSVEAVGADRAFQELGFDSLAATELRNQLNTLTGLRLPATLVFDHPNALAVTEHIVSRLDGSETARAADANGAGAGRPADDEPIAIHRSGAALPGVGHPVRTVATWLWTDRPVSTLTTGAGDT
ncbi:acyl carrier protein [Streptomyces sp. DHE17-7]|uniref:acyl carrier protein n=1 Tax=Streptomyces sp. DHE17-7 TaxID=2759949 RepID=UPI002FCE201A|nr:acyl carrier protein [Streptomyces sp. DHE17-7]